MAKEGESGQATELMILWQKDIHCNKIEFLWNKYAK